MEKGIKGSMEITVTNELTAINAGSGLLPVYGTPFMIALIENTACHCALPELEEGQGTVGTRLEVDHLGATPIGMRVRCEVELIEIDRKKLVFAAEVFDEEGLVGRGRHERFIIDTEKFMEKALAKAKT